MVSSSEAAEGGSGIRQAGAGAWADLPGYSIFDVVAILWREKWAALAAALIVVLIGGALVYQMPRKYKAVAQVLVLPDEAYDPDPVVGEANPYQSGLIAEQVARAEEEIFRSEDIKRRVLAERGIAATFPDLLIGDAPGDANRILSQAILSFNESFGTTLDAPVITATFTAKDPQLAADVLNSMLDEYLSFRLEVLLGDRGNSLAEERDSAEARLILFNQQLSQLQAQHNVGDYASDVAGLTLRIAAVEGELINARANSAANRQRLNELQSQTASTAAEVELYVEDQADARLEALQSERRQLSARYRPESRIIRNLDAQIAALQQELDTRETPRGARRIGVNPVRQSLETERAQVAGQSAAEQARVSALTNQLDQLRRRQQLLQTLEPQFQRLERERAVLEQTVGRITQTLEERRTRLSLQDQRVRPIQRAQPPVKGSSGRALAGLGVLVLAGLVGILAALIRGFSRGAPTRAAAERSLGMEVLAVVASEARR
jgi:uncharacterized protein involved in exopolysaccharide biosynthesis